MVTTTPFVVDEARVPERSLAQRMHALAYANEIRTQRATYKRDLKAGRADLVDGLLEPPAWLETAKVLDLLLAVPKVGRVKASKILRVVVVSPSKTIGGLSQRQRTELVVALRGAVRRPSRENPVMRVPVRRRPCVSESRSQ